MTTTALPSTLHAPRNIPKELPVEDSNCKKMIQAIIAIAIKILVPLATALLMYFTLPLSINVVAIPVVTTASFFALAFFFKVKQNEPVLPLSRTAPSGLQNKGGNDCWLNSLAQLIRIDKEMKKWFTEVPRDLDAHATYFRFFSQELLENLPEVLPPEAYADLAVNDVEGRQTINNYAVLIRGLNPAEKQKLFRYFKFLRQFPLAERPGATPTVIASSLLEFKKFMVAYDEGARARPGQVLTIPNETKRQLAPPQQPGQPSRAPIFNSHALRQAIANVTPEINIGDAYGNIHENSQQDPTEGLALFTLFFPNDLKVQLQERSHYALPRNEKTGQLQPLVDPADDAFLIGNNVIARNEPPTLGLIQCDMRGSYPNMKNFLERYFEDPNDDPTNRITREVDGVEYAFQLVKTERQFLTAPSSLWLPPKRFIRVEPQWVGLHRIMPNWFEARPADQIKNEAPIEFQEILEIQPINGPLARYKLDGFICHRGNTPKSGHYVSYRLGKDDENNEAWFEMNDDVVTRISDAQMRAVLATAYLPHYSKIDE